MNFSSCGVSFSSRGALAPLLVTLILLLTACAGNQDAFNPAGPQSGQIKSLWLLMFWISVLVELGVAVALFGALLRRNQTETPEAESRATRNVGYALAFTVLTVLVILIASALTGRSLASTPKNEFNINVTGHQWWWNFEYTDGAPNDRFQSPNEIHIPTGRPVRLHLTSVDVIHSFWVPNLHGKMDAIPAHNNTYWLQADKPGVFWGQCAEFCGLQHAHMKFMVIAEEPAKFEQWRDAQRAPSALPRGDEQNTGRQVFLNSPCPVCHMIRGTDAHGRVGPELTHLASRQTIAAGTLPNTRGNLGGWIVDSHRIKPGNNMPPMHLLSEQVEPLLTYLENLK